MGYLSTTPVNLTTAWVQIAAANEPVLFQRVSGYDVIYQIAEDEPDVESVDGHRLNDYKPVGFTASNPVWVRSVGDSVLHVSVGEVISANQTTLQGAQGTGASYDPPTGGSGVFGWLSGIYKEIVSGIKLKVSGSEISLTNPLPTATGKGTSTSVEVQAGRMNVVRASKAAVAGEFARVQIHNAGTEVLQIPAIQAWAGSAGTHIYSVYEVETHDASAALSNVVKNCRLGNTPSADIEVYSRSSASAITTTGLFSQVSSAVVTPSGTSLILTGTQITIPAGKTIEIAIGTAFVSLNVVVAVNVI